ncbi:MAG: aliphatic sulfonate ABC transporter substrate-binding protein [Ruminococcaceae bacterium]|nr:aliphatic sulfonate ABC transporter substrate-binding protein [Oscillospiraceae bacterium]
MKKSVFFLILLVSLFCFTACNTPDDGFIHVRIACFPNITHSQALIGMAQNSFETALGEDTKVEWHTFNAGPSEIEAIFAGEVDIGYIGPIPAINGYSKSEGEIRIIAGATGAGSLLVTRSGLKLKELKELDGKKVAVPQFANTQDILLRDLILKEGLKDRSNGGTVDIIASENPNIKLLIDRGDIDAAFVPEPWGTRLAEETGANVLLDYDDIYDNGNYPTALIVASKDFLEKHPDKVEAFLREHIRLTDYINANKNEAAVMVADQIERLTGSRLSEELIKKSFGKLIVTSDPYKNALGEFVNAYQKLGYMSVKTDFSFLTDTSILDKILSE